MSSRRTVILTAVGAVVLAAFGALPPVFDVYGGLRVEPWLIRFVCAAAAALALLFSVDGRRDGGPAFWHRATAALSLAALAPLAMESAGQTNLPALTFAFTALAAFLVARGTDTWATGAAIAAGSACGLAGVLWPLGYAWAAFARGRETRRASFLLGAATIGVVAGRSGLLAPAAGRALSSAYAAHRDMTILLPVFMLGLAGYMKGARNGRRAARDADVPWPAGWAGLAIIGLALAIVGFPLDVRVCMLPFWWWMPAGLQQLRRAVVVPGARAKAVRWVALMSCMLVAVCCWAGLCGWLDGPLLAIYMLTGS
jgi:hypothetical protein